MDIHERLAAHLKSEMARAPQPNPGAVMDRGDEIKSRRRLITTSGVGGILAAPNSWRRRQI